MEVKEGGSFFRLLRLFVTLRLATSILSEWKELEDSKGRVYYLNRATGRTSWHAPRVVQGSCQAACGTQTCETWLIKKADSYGAGNRELQCSLAHASMLEVCHAKCQHCMVPDTSCNHELKFSCKEAGFQTVDSWSPQRKSWCCQHFHVGCHSHHAFPAPYDCEAGLHTAQKSWSEAKLSWCCSNERKGCKFDCFAGLDDWQEGWPLEKRAWCCKHSKLGCIKPDESACKLQAGESPDRWTSVRRHYCCKIEGIGCVSSTPAPAQSPDHPHHCTGRHWPLEKIKWCCLAKKIGCKLLASTTTTTPMPDLFDCQAGLKNWGESWSHRKKEWCCSRKHIGCAFDCRQDLKTWEVSWTGLQKTFCCQHFHVGCAGGRYECVSGRMSLWPAAQRHWCCRHQGRGCGKTIPLPHCDIKKKESWSPANREYCCGTLGLGCIHGHRTYHVYHVHELPPATLSGHYHHQVLHPVIHHTHTAMPSFDCAEGEENAWPGIKRHWCCSYANVGCGLHTGALQKGFQYNCDAYDLQWATWTAKKKRMCCQDYGVGCSGWSPRHHTSQGPAIGLHPSAQSKVLVAQTSFECGGGHQASWASEKRLWCCSHHGVGCVSRASHKFSFRCNADDPHAVAAWSVQKQQYCCHDYGVGCPDVLSGHAWHSQVLRGYRFNCLAGGLPHQWSLPKRGWCCKHESLGCSDAAGYDCHPGAAGPGAWPRAQTLWCCEHRKVGCGSLPERYDCTKGLANPQEWSHAKQEYCCDTVKVGCPKPIKPAELLTPSAQHDLHRQALKRRSQDPKYNCAAGLQHWQDSWSQDKAEWCCKYRGYGCPFHCHGNPQQQADWSPERAGWCCKQHDIACRYVAKYQVNNFKLSAMRVRGFWPLLAAAGLSVTLVAFVAVMRLNAARRRREEVKNLIDLDFLE